MSNSYIITRGGPPILINETGPKTQTMLRGMQLDESGSGSFMAAVDTPDGAAFLGYSGPPGYSGQLVSTEAPDVFAGAGYPALVFSFALTEGQDSFHGFMLQPKTGHLASTEATDTFAATGHGYGVTLTLHVSEATDQFAASGTSFQPVHGPLTVSEAPDNLRFLGAGATVSIKRPVFFVT